MLHTHLVRDVREVAAPASEVFALLADVERWPSWCTGIQSARRLGRGPLRVGSSILYVPRFVPIPIAARVLGFERDRVFSWGLRTPIASMIHGFSVEPIDERTCVVRQSEFAEDLLAIAARPLRRAIHAFDRAWSADLERHFARDR